MNCRKLIARLPMPCIENAQTIMGLTLFFAFTTAVVSSMFTLCAIQVPFEEIILRTGFPVLKPYL